MRSVNEDLSTKARIRVAAIAQYGTHGFVRTTIRMVADAASVSPGLVIHHFGSKSGLRTACDALILGRSEVRAHDAEDAHSWGPKIGEYLANIDAYLPEVAYIRQSMVDDSAAGTSFFDALVAQTEEILTVGIANGTVRELEDLRGTAVVMASYSMGMLTVGKHVARCFGSEEIDAKVMSRIGVPALELYTLALYTDSSMLEAAKAELGQTTSPRPQA